MKQCIISIFFPASVGYCGLMHAPTPAVSFATPFTDKHAGIFGWRNVVGAYGRP